MAGTSGVEEVRPSLIRIAAATNREDKLREFESFFLQWRDNMHSLFADFRADFRESLHSKSVVDTSCLQPMIAESHDSLEVADDSIAQIGQGPSIYGSNNCTEANPKDLEAATLTESNFIPADIQESHTSLVRDVNTEIDPCNYCLVDSQVQDHLLLVSNPEVVFNQSGHKRIDEQRSKGNSLIDPSQDLSLGGKSVEQGCVNPISFPDELQVFTNSGQDTCFESSHKAWFRDCFDRIICFETINPIHKVDSQNGSAASESKPIVPEIFDIMKYAAESNSDVVLPKTPVVCKPFEDSFERVFKIADIDPERTLFFDDSIHNLTTAKQMGLHTVLVGSSHRLEGIDYALESIHNIKEAFPELLEVDDKAGER